MQKKINGWIATTIIGSLIMLFGFLPLAINATQQCPGNALSMPDGSSCIVGAPIGLPIWLIGLVIAIIGGTGFLISRKRTKK